MLKFSEANAKTKRLRDIAYLQRFLPKGRKVYSLDLLSGWSCPGARDCLAKVYVKNGKRSLKDGRHTRFRCFSASQEVAYPNTYRLRKHNFNLLRYMRGPNRCFELLQYSLPKNLGILRFHVAGDFFKRAYLEAAVKLAEANPDRLFYGYTKALDYLQYVDMIDPRLGVVRPNFLLTGSVGGKFDTLLERTGLRTATVVFNEDEADILELPIDHDDSHAATVGGSFALLLHGVQPAGSVASKAVQVLRGAGSYSR